MKLNLAAALSLMALAGLIALGAWQPQSAAIATAFDDDRVLAPSRAAQIEKLPRAPEGKLISSPLRPGEVAPDFVLSDQNGKRHRLFNLRGKTVVLQFYPQDFTYSCAGQALDYSAALPKFYERDAIVFGVSVQPMESKKRFAEKFGITYPLLADEEHTVARAYGVLSEYGTAARVTFIIGRDGRIVSTDQSVRALTDARDTLSTLDRLQPKRVTQRIYNLP
jgi:peroxiredoxin Q/BCP